MTESEQEVQVFSCYSGEFYNEASFIKDNAWRTRSSDVRWLCLQAAPATVVHMEVSEIVAPTAVADYNVNTEANGYEILSFRANDAGTYVFYSMGTDDTEAWLFQNEIAPNLTKAELNNLDCLEYSDQNSDGANVDWIGNNNNFSIRHNLNAGDTVYLVVRNYYSGPLDNVKVYVVKEA